MKNVTKYIIGFIFILFINSCASQNIDRKDKVKLAYLLINHHFSNNYNKGKQNYIYHKTLGKDSATILMRESGISNFLRNEKSSSLFKKCQLDSTLSKKAQIKLDSLYANFKEVELNPKKLKSKNILLVFTNVNVYKKELVGRITFPIIIQDKGVYYGILTHSDVYGGELYFFKYIGGKWELICHKMLFVV